MRWVPLNEHRLVAKPVGDIEHLMQQGDVPDDDTSHIEAVEEALHNMDESMQEVLLAVYAEQVPFSELGERLGVSKTQAWRKAKQALELLGNTLSTNQIIRKRYNMTPATWEEAAWAAIESFERPIDANRPADRELLDFCARELRLAAMHGRDVPTYATSQIGIEAVRELRFLNMWHPQAFLRTLCSKQHDYGHENINAFGMLGVAVRLHDKVARLRNLSSKEAALNEPLLDTWLDMIGYAVIAEMLITNTFNLELETA